MGRLDIMVDLETLGTGDNSTVFQVSSVAFDITTGAKLGTFNEIIDIAEQDIKVEGKTLKWWLDTDRELLNKLINDKSAKSSKSVWYNFVDWIWLVSLREEIASEDVYLWGNGIMFDNLKVKNEIERIGSKYPIKYSNDRDVRTILELASMKSGLTQKEIKDSANQSEDKVHDALSDCLHQIRYVHKCYNILMEGD